MKILILGSSKVAQSLACELVDEGNDITVVSEDAAVLKNMQTLPNPPEEIVENDKFAINFILNIN